MSDLKKCYIFLYFGYTRALPNVDEPVYFDSKEEMQALMDLYFPANLLPPPNETFHDKLSDEGLMKIAFYGIGQTILKKFTDNQKITYEVDTTVLSDLETRPEYEMYGANAFFGGDKKILHIFVSSLNKIVKPGDTEWNHAKWVWKVSLLSYVTIGPHLVEAHWIVSNIALIATRTTLGAEHCIRRVLKVFQYNTGMVNYKSTLFLSVEDGFLHRLTGLTYEALGNGFKTFAENFKYETFPDFVASKGLNEETCIPIVTDGIPVWNVFKKFFKSYVDIFYQDDSEILADLELVAFWECIDARGNFGSPWSYGLPKLGKESLIDYLTHVAFVVTAWHEQVGYVIQYMETPDPIGFKIRPGKEELDVQAFVQGLCLVGLTGLNKPMLISNWKHLLPSNPNVHKLHTELMKDLNQLTKDIEDLNITAPDNPKRPHASQIFNPKFFETSISL